MSEPRLVAVAVPLGVSGTFTYRVPAEFGELRPGTRVVVPFGARKTTGFVIDSKPGEVDLSRLRDVVEVLDAEQPALTPEILALCRWAADYYLAPLGEMLRSALPSNLGSRGERSVSITAGSDGIAKAIASGAIQEKDLTLVDEITKAGRISAGAISRKASLQRLLAAEIASLREEVRDRAGVRLDRFVILESPPSLLPDRQQQVVELLRAAGGELPYGRLLELGASGSSVQTLIRKNVLRVDKRPARGNIDAFISGPIAGALLDLRHSEEQSAAIEKVNAAFGTFAPFLLQGITGSGKTEVYIELMRRAVERGGAAIMLVPEISLTPVFAGRLRQRFGDRVAILHSSLSPGEKYDQWIRCRRGEVDVAIGPRSALFTPFENLALIAVDEEGDAAYKQDESPRYNGRDLAVVRAQLAGIPVILGSATPSLESRENAARGKYDFIQLTHRVEQSVLPEVEIVDLRRERGEKEDRGMVIFTLRLIEELERTIDAGEQAMILMNRRGYAPYLLCRECEHDFRCTDCSVTLTVHRRDQLLICHYCGFRRAIPQQCPACNGEVLQPIGFGTEKVEERFRRLFPAVPVEVLDRDSTRRKGELVRILERFRKGESRVLIGTQMISKGHHFPDVTLTGVINADSILGYPDFRSAEKTFYLLTQVAGRSGRGEKPGRVLIQTGYPSHYAIRHAASHDFEAFYTEEIEFRRRFHYPPFTAIVSILIRGEDLKQVDEVATRLGKAIEKETAGIGVRIQGPAPAPLERVKGVFRYQLLIRSAQRAQLRRAVARATASVETRRVEIIVDVDPINIL
jgi:primosomal protein N' (replication factor Y) (superfamily II helicase)